MKQIIVLLFTASFLFTGCSDSKKNFLPFSDSSGDPAKTQANVGSGGGTTAVAASNVTQARPACTTSPCNAGSAVTITVNFTQAVNVNGVPTLILNNGRVATYVSGSGTTDLVFTYTVSAGDDVLALNYQDTSSLVLSNNSTVTLVSTGNNADTTLPPPTGTGSMPSANTVVIDTSIPSISSVTALNQNGTYVKDGKLYITVTVSEAVIVEGVPTLALNTGNSTNGSATYISGSGTNTLTFEYTVRPGDKVADLNYVSTNSLTGGTIKDAANNVATVTLPETTAATSLGGAKDIALDTTPKVASITTTTANGTYTAGSVINFTVTFTDAVTTTGPVTLTLANGATATCTNVTNSSTMNCAYTVQTGDTSADLTYRDMSSLTGGTVTSAANPTLTAVRTLPEPSTFATSHDIVISAPAATPTISFSSTSGNVAENGGNYSVTFNLSAPSTQDITFTIASGNGTAIGGTDFTAVNQVVTIPAGQTSFTLNIPVTNDGVYEGNETFTLSMSGVSANATLAASATQTVTITDDETAPTVSLTENTTKTVLEDVGNYVFSVTLSGTSSVDTVVNVNTANGTALSGSDYSAVVAGTITIPAGQTTGTINIPVTNDNVFEGGAGGTKETFAVTISGPTVTGGATQTVSITDNETAPTLSFTAGAANTVAENVGGGNYAATFTLTGPTSTDVTFTLASAGGTATSGTDFTAYNQTVTIPAGQTSVSVNIAITDDASAEGSENFTLTMSGASANATLAAANVQTVTINDNEVPTVSFTAGETNSVGEGAGNYTVNFTLSAAAAANVTFTLATANGTATAGSDYTAYNQTVTITAGQTTGTATIVISNDTVYEGNENFTLTMSGVSGNANLAAVNVQTVSITDNEAVPTVSLSAATYSGAEGGAITISVTRTGASQVATTVTLATAITGTGATHAISGTDFTAYILILFNRCARIY